MDFFMPLVNISILENLYSFIKNLLCHCGKSHCVQQWDSIMVQSQIPAAPLQVPAPCKFSWKATVDGSRV